MKCFTTTQQLLFLELITLEQGMQLQVNAMPIQEAPPFDSWFRTVDIDARLRAGTEHSREYAASVLGNDIAYQTRRGAGNILFVPNYDVKEYFENSRFQNMFKVLIYRDLAPNELRCTYWKGPTWGGKVIDGGVQFSPDGFSCLPNYSAYFARCFL